MTNEQTQRINENIRKYTGKTWSQVVEDFESEMRTERAKFGLKPWEFLTTDLVNGSKKR